MHHRLWCRGDEADNLEDEIFPPFNLWVKNNITWCVVRVYVGSASPFVPISQPERQPSKTLAEVYRADFVFVGHALFPYTFAPLRVSVGVCDYVIR